MPISTSGSLVGGRDFWRNCMRSLPNAEDAAEALRQLRESEDDLAKLFGQLVLARERLKIAKAANLPRSGTALEREAAALTSAEYELAVSHLADVEHQHKLMCLRRVGWEELFNFWRTLEASRRIG